MVEVLPGSPLASQIESGWFLVEVDGTNVLRMAPRAICRMLKKEAHRPRELKLLPDDWGCVTEAGDERALA